VQQGLELAHRGDEIDLIGDTLGLGRLAEPFCTCSLDEAAVVQRLEMEAVAGIEIPETRVVVLVGMGDDSCVKRDFHTGVAAEVEAPRQKPSHVVVLARVDEQEIVTGGDDETAIALTDVDEVDLEQTLVLDVCLFHPAVDAARPDRYPIAALVPGEPDVVAPDGVTSRLSTRRYATGAISTALMGLVGLAFVAGSTLNFPNDLEAARAAGSPQWASWLLAAIHLPLGLALASQSFLALRARRRQPAKS
jgi:hypothetical protein